MRRLKKLLPGVGCVLLVAGSIVAPSGRWVAADPPPTCTIIEGEQGCLVPPIVATGLPPVPVRPFENQTAPQAPYSGPVEPNGCGRGSDLWPYCGRP